MFIETYKLLPADTPLAIEFLLPANNNTIACKARVAWVNGATAPVKPSLPPGMGIQFLDLSLKQVRTIRQFVDTYDIKPIW
jgi:Tfp pilus assembly protein PilZ